jgi:DNA-binding GntR family transcriptional regulator
MFRTSNAYNPRARRHRSPDLAIALQNGKTLSQTVCDQVVDEIVRGELTPGTRLDEQSLADRFGVSRSPVRDALRQLAATRLVLYVPHRGFSVASVDSVELESLFETAGEIEALCAKLCALRAGPAERAHIEVVHGRGKEAVAANDLKAYVALNDELHDLIYAGARNAVLQEIASNLRQRLTPFRSGVFFANDNRMLTSIHEHSRLINAILAHDSEEAARAMREHAARSALNALHYFSTKARETATA